MTAPVIASNSVSYPVRGAALAAGVDYGLALAWVDHVGSPDGPGGPTRALIGAHGSAATGHFVELIDDAWEDRRVRIVRWAPETGGWRP